MGIDHSKTYKEKSFKNLPHRMRLNAIHACLDDKIESGNIRYADFGCSNGYITDLITRRYQIEEAHGFDHEEQNLAIARENYPSIQFGTVDLNRSQSSGQYDIVTCFETLEHVGNIPNALQQLLSSTANGGTLLITVPIEIGIRGIIKFLLKTILYHRVYKAALDELPGEKIYFKYFKSLFSGVDMSKFRDDRSGWSTHFGFDYRVISELLHASGYKFSVHTKFTTCFFIVEK